MAEDLPVELRLVLGVDVRAVLDDAACRRHVVVVCRREQPAVDRA
jgi:hypothetical protein